MIGRLDRQRVRDAVADWSVHHPVPVIGLVIGERILAMRRRNPLDWRTNVSRGATAEPFVPDECLADIARRAAALAGRKPSNTKRSVGRPATDKAAINAQGPGIGTTWMPAWRAARMKIVDCLREA